MYRVALALGLLVLSFGAGGVVAPSVVRAQTSAPVVAVSPNTVAAGSTATVSGSGFTPNNYVFAYWQRPDGSVNGIYAFTNAGGAFSLTLGFDPQHGAGNEYVSAYDYGTGRWAPFVTISVTNGTPPAAMALSAAPNPVKVGASATVTGSGFSGNNYVYVQWTRPDKTTAYTFAYTDAAGSFSLSLGFAAGHGCGTEVLQAYDYGRATWSASYNVAVSC